MPLRDRLFAFKIDYDQPGGDGTPLYNGNISATYWRVKGDDKKRSYTYEYDALNRLTDANYAIPYYNPQVHQIDIYNEGVLQYDKNGNILHLERYGLKADGSAIDKIDELDYLYTPTSNKLVQVTDAGDAAGFSDVTPANGIDYKYDGNGNMIYDVNKDIESITYNHLNLPTQIIFKGGKPLSSTPKYITYAYDAAGTKLEKRVIRTPDGQPTVTTVTQYSNGYIYENNVLQYFGHAEGYVAHDNGNFKYIYQYKDHLGNVRVSYAKGENGLDLIEENNYYAFGLKHKGYGAAYNLASGERRCTERKV